MIERLCGPRTHICWTPDGIPEVKREQVTLVREIDLIDLEAQLSTAEKLIACYRQHLGDVVTYGADAESLDKMLAVWVPRAKKAEAKIAVVRKSLENCVDLLGCSSLGACEVKRLLKILRE